MTAATGQPEPLTAGQLDEIEQRANRICRCDDPECVAELRQMADTDVPALIAALRQLRPEYGIRVTYVGGRTFDAALGTDPDYARDRIADLDAEKRADVVSREPLQRKVSSWTGWDPDA